jgi:hypothetical protein
MPLIWMAQELAAATGETTARLAEFADAGLLPHRDDGGYDADGLDRINLIHFAEQRGVGVDRLAAAVTAQGDLLGIFEGFSNGEATSYTLAQACTEVGLPEELMCEITQLLAWDPSTIATTEDVDALRLLAQATSAGLDREPLLQLVRVYADLLDRLADAEVRIFHDYVHDRFAPTACPGGSCSARPTRWESPCSPSLNRRCCTSTGVPGRR